MMKTLEDVKREMVDEIKEIADEHPEFVVGASMVHVMADIAVSLRFFALAFEEDMKPVRKRGENDGS